MFESNLLKNTHHGCKVYIKTKCNNFSQNDILTDLNCISIFLFFLFAFLTLFVNNYLDECFSFFVSFLFSRFSHP